jgi:hypothetical protein
MKFTHKGWFGFCPVYFANLESISPFVHERHWIFTPVMILNEWIFGALFFILTSINNEYEPMWPLKVTSEINETT